MCMLLIPQSAFMVFLAARVGDDQGISITACKAAVKYDLIHKNLSEIKDTAARSMRLPAGSPADKRAQGTARNAAFKEELSLQVSQAGINSLAGSCRSHLISLLVYRMLHLQHLSTLQR